MAKKSARTKYKKRIQKASNKLAKQEAKRATAVIQLRKKALIQRKKRAILTEKVISPRHKANLVDPNKPFEGKRTDLRSTALVEFDYDPLTRTLRIIYWGYKQRYIAGEYLYLLVPQRAYEDLLDASSKGRHVNRHIKGKYNFRRIS